MGAPWDCWGKLVDSGRSEAELNTSASGVAERGQVRRYAKKTNFQPGLDQGRVESLFIPWCTYPGAARPPGADVFFLASIRPRSTSFPGKPLYVRRQTPERDEPVQEGSESLSVIQIPRRTSLAAALHVIQVEWPPRPPVCFGVSFPTSPPIPGCMVGPSKGLHECTTRAGVFSRAR